MVFYLVETTSIDLLVVVYTTWGLSQIGILPNIPMRYRHSPIGIYITRIHLEHSNHRSLSTVEGR